VFYLCKAQGTVYLEAFPVYAAGREGVVNRNIPSWS